MKYYEGIENDMGEIQLSAKGESFRTSSGKE